MDNELIKSALEYLNKLKHKLDEINYASLTDYVDLFDCTSTINKALLKAQELEKENDELLQAVALFKQKLEDTNDIKIATTMMKQLDTNIRLEKEKNEYKKILDIIKEKEVNMQVFNQCEDVETYNKVYIKQKDRQLTQEEFDLLKRWLENE